MKPTETTERPTGTATKGRRVNALEWLRAVHRRSGLSIPARGVAAVLFARMDPDGASCFPSLATVAADAGYQHGRSVAPHLTELERGGWIIRERRPRKGRDHEATRYYATIPINRPSDGFDTEAGEVVGADRQGLSSDTDNPVGADRHDLATDLASDLASEDLDPRSDAPRSDAPPPDPDRVLGDYPDNPYRGGQRLAACDVDPVEAHRLIADRFASGSAEERACRAGYHDGTASRRVRNPKDLPINGPSGGIRALADTLADTTTPPNAPRSIP